MRILFLTQFFEPEPFFKGLPFARELVRRGHDVEVLTGFPNYPGGKLYDGYSIRPWVREELDGVPVVRVPLYPSHDRSRVRRVMNYGSFGLSASTLGAALVQRPDVIYVYHPPATVGAAAIALGSYFKVPFVYDVVDLWPESISASGIPLPPRMLGAVNMLCRLIYDRAAAVVTVTDGIRDVLRDRGVPSEKLFVIRNWCDEAALLQGAPVAPREPDGKFNILFAGNIGAAQGLESVLDAAEILRDRQPHVRFTFVGGGVDQDRLRRHAADAGLRNVTFLGHRPVHQMPEMFAQADGVLVHLRDEHLFSITVPSKTQAYMAMGKPIIMAVRGEAATLVDTARAGVTCPPRDPAALVEAVERLLATSETDRRAMGERGRVYYRENLALAIGAARFEAIFEWVMHSRAERPPY